MNIQGQGPQFGAIKVTSESLNRVYGCGTNLSRGISKDLIDQLKEDTGIRDLSWYVNKNDGTEVIFKTSDDNAAKRALLGGANIRAWDA